MFLSNGEMQQAASDIRALAAAMSAVAAELDRPGTWTGHDAQVFQRDWNDQVLGRLNSAAAKLDGITFEEIAEPFVG